MNWIKSEKNFIEINENLFCFKRIEDKVVMTKYSENKVAEEKIIIDECKVLNSVILGGDQKLSIITTNTKNELMLYILSGEEIITKVALVKAIPEAKYVEIASINNTINIFYINEINNISTINFRILNSKLSLSPPVVIDSIDNKGDIPYKISANEGQLLVCYLRVGNPNIIGYRRFDFAKNSWSNFINLDNCYGLIKDFNFVALGKKLAYNYVYYKQRKPIICFGIGEEQKVNKGTLSEEEPYLVFSNIEISSENNLKLNYIMGNTIKVKEIDINAELKSSDEFSIDNITEINRYRYSYSENPGVNEILVLNNEKSEIILNKYYFMSLNVRKYQETLGINKYIEGDIFFTEVEIDTDDDLDSDSTDITVDKNTFKELKLKIKTYEEMLKKVSENILMGEDEKKKLLANIDYLTEQINKKNYTINAYEKAFTERQSILMANEKKIMELTEAIKNNQVRANSIEINKLKELLSSTELQNNNNRNEIRTLNLRIEELNMLNKNKNDELLNLSQSYESLQNQSNSKVAQLKELINVNNIEKNNYISEINDLKKNNAELINTITMLSEENTRSSNEVRTLSERIQEQNLILLDNNSQINLLQNQLLILEEKNKESFIKKLFKNE